MNEEGAQDRGYARKYLVKVAAYQAPLLASGSMDALGLIRTRVEWCESEGVTILCCPEAILGGLADYSGHPTQFAIAADAGGLNSALAPLASDTVTTLGRYATPNENFVLVAVDQAAVFRPTALRRSVRSSTIR